MKFQKNMNMMFLIFFKFQGSGLSIWRAFSGNFGTKTNVFDRIFKYLDLFEKIDIYEAKNSIKINNNQEITIKINICIGVLKDLI